MKSADRFSLNQLLALCSVMALTPALRLLPPLSARLAGRGAWLSVLLALPVSAAYGLFLWHFASLRRAGESLPALWLRAAGQRTGRVLLILCGLWLSFYAAFTLRDSAQRLIGTVYPRAGRALFILPMGLIAALAAAGPARTLARLAKLVLPLLIGAIALTLLASLRELRAANLLPVTGAQLPAVMGGLLPTFDVAALILTLFFLLSDRLTGERRFRRLAGRIFLLGGLMALLTAAVVGCFGHELTARLSQPYFSLVRNLVFFRSVERMEALLVTLWLFSDYLLSAVLLHCAGRCLAPHTAAAPRFSAALGALAVLTACLLAPGAEAFARLSERWVPAANLCVCLLLTPGVYLLGRLRKRL